MDKAIKKEITNRIKTLRNKHGLTQEEMAEKVGLEYGSYVQMENGANLPSVNVLMRLSVVLNTSVDFILFGTKITGESDIIDTERIVKSLKQLNLSELENARKLLDNLIKYIKICEKTD